MGDTDVQIDFYAPAILRKWPSLNNERVSASLGSCPYLVVEGSLTMMYEAIRGALAGDDAQKRQGSETRFRVRETPDWREHAADLEAEMLRRGMMFEVIDLCLS
jgi:hypothetical protein